MSRDRHVRLFLLSLSWPTGSLFSRRAAAVGDRDSGQHYPAILFPQEEAYACSCTARSTIFTANIAAGLIAEQFARWLRLLPVGSDLQLNLLFSELMVTGGAR